MIFRAEPNLDERGYVLPTYNKSLFEQLDCAMEIVHENHCCSQKRGTIRRFHFQIPPFGQAKLIRVLRGRILDVNIDLRKGSPTFEQHSSVELSHDDWNQTLVPEGFAHCYCTLENDTEVLFKLGCAYALEHARGLAWNDPSLNIKWPIKDDQAIVLKQDLDRPLFKDMSVFIPYPNTVKWDIANQIWRITNVWNSWHSSA